jgi:mono/diheme cytochrome c family protein
MAKHCAGCHGATRPASGLNLLALGSAASGVQQRATWEHVLQKLRAGEMPPPGQPRPPAAQLQQATRWIDRELARADASLRPEPGRVTARRLNRVEYNNTIRDLLGVDLRPADDFPQDDSGYGFDNIGDVLSLSPGLLEKYLTAAEQVARTALFGPGEIKPTLVRLQTQGRAIVPSSTPLMEYDVTGLSLPGAAHVTYRFPLDGEYVIRGFLGGVRPSGSAPLRIALWIDGQPIRVSEIDPEARATFTNDRQDLGGQVMEFRAPVRAGDRWLAMSVLRLYDGLPADYKGPNPSLRPLPGLPRSLRRFLEPPPDATPEQLAEYRRRLEARRARQRAAVPVNDVRIGRLEVGGPHAPAQGPSPESLKRIFTCGHLRGGHGPGCAQKIVSDLARRAFRRPVSAAEVDPYLRLVSLARKRGDSFEEGIGVALQAILVSPHFLFRVEKEPPARGRTTSHPISQHELASRLSYFLWSSMPDEDLLRCADAKTLRQPAVLKAQVRRMLRDPRSRALVENFGGQWLELRKLEAAKPDRERFPEFDAYLRMSMEQETEAFFAHIVREDRPILDFIDGNYTYLNERLARFYGVPGVKGAQFRKVALSDPRRGGVLTQASVLTVSSYANRTSPVLRGKWVLENLLSAAPPPPPAGVPTLDEAKVAQAASLRKQLEAHRANPTCASCHTRMDSLGFALENYDAIGAWRAEEAGTPIDASGTLPDGRSVRGPAELRAVLKGDRDAFAECLTEKLLTYALGRGLERYDRPTVTRIVGRLPAGGYRFSILVLEIVNSVPFQNRSALRTAVGAPTTAERRSRWRS